MKASSLTLMPAILISVCLGYGEVFTPLTLQGQQVKEGEVLNLDVSIQELK